MRVCSLYPFYSNNVRRRLKTWTGNEGRIRLSEDDGPPAHSFVGDDDDDIDDEPLALRAERLREGGLPSSPGQTLQQSQQRGRAPVAKTVRNGTARRSGSADEEMGRELTVLSRD